MEIIGGISLEIENLYDFEKGMAIKMEKPNILIFYTDQQSTWSISVLGARDILTPNIDRIGNEGAILNNFYTPCAVCTPSRGSFLTGDYPCRHGAYRNNVSLSDDAETFAQVLLKEGYQTGYSGKWHLSGAGKPHWLKREEARGFEDSRYMFNRGHWKFIEERDDEEHPSVLSYMDNYMKLEDTAEWIGDESTYTTDWLCSKTAQYIQERDKTKPFLYMTSIPDPHTPFCVRKPYDTMFDPEALHLPETYYQYCPEWMPEGVQPKKNTLENFSEEEGKKKLAQYLGEVKCIDDNVGKVIKVLEQEKILDDTIVIFTSDHGEYMGEHGLWGKNCLYPSCYRVPFLIRWPKKIQQKSKISELISAVDFKETLLSLVGIKSSGKGCGVDASGFLTGQPAEAWENKIYVNGMLFQEVGLMTEEYYIAFRKDGFHMTFDMKKDPLQTNNLYRNHAYADIIQSGREDLIRHCRAVKSPALNWLEQVC